MARISKEKFEAVYNKYPPSKWVSFAYKYFSKETEKKDLSIRNGVAYSLIGLFTVGFLGTAFNAPREIVRDATFIYAIMLVTLVAYLFSAIILNNFRIKKIIKELGINKFEYNQLVEKLYS